MRFPLVLLLLLSAAGVTLLVLAAPSAVANELGATPQPEGVADLGDFVSPLTWDECSDLADAADEVYQDWRDAEFVESGVCSVYGIFSGQCVAAVLYSEYKERQFQRAAERYFECHDAQQQ